MGAAACGAGSNDANSSANLTLFAGLSATQVSNHTGDNPEAILTSFRDAMFSAGYGQGEVVVVLCPEHVGYLGGAGWSKADCTKRVTCTRMHSARWRNG